MTDERRQDATWTIPTVTHADVCLLPMPLLEDWERRARQAAEQAGGLTPAVTALIWLREEMAARRHTPPPLQPVTVPVDEAAP